MKYAFEWLLALRFLKEGRMQSWLILAGVTGGVAIIIFLTQLINQLQNDIVDRVLSVQPHISLRPTEEQVKRLTLTDTHTAARIQQRGQRLRSIDQWENFAHLAKQTPGVQAVSALATGPVFIRNNLVSQSVAIMGIIPKDYLQVVDMKRYLVQGQFQLQSDQVVIGTDLAKDLGIALNDRVQIINEAGIVQNLTIVGIFDVNHKDLNKHWVFVPLRIAQSILNIPGGVSSIDLKVTHLFQAQTIANRLARQTGLKVESWMETNAGLLNALDNQTVTNGLIRFFIVIIVALGIASVLVVSVVQKQKEIGILRAMGATQQQILRIFLLQGAIFGSLGSILGISLALGLLTLFALLYKPPDGTLLFTATLNPYIAMMASLLAMIVGMLAAWLPARRAARMDPVQAIRN